MFLIGINKKSALNNRNYIIRKEVFINFSKLIPKFFILILKQKKNKKNFN